MNPTDPRPQNLSEVYQHFCGRLFEQLESAGTNFAVLRDSPEYSRALEYKALARPLSIWDDSIGNLARAVIDYLITQQIRDFEISVTASRILEIWRMLLRERIEPQQTYHCSLHVAEISIWDNATVSKGLGSLFLLKNLVVQSQCNGKLILTKLGVNLSHVTVTLSSQRDSWEEASYERYFRVAGELRTALTPGSPWGSDHLLLALFQDSNQESRAGLFLRRLGIKPEDVERLLMALPRESQQLEWPDAAKISFAYLPDETETSETATIEQYEKLGWALTRALRPWIEAPPSLAVATLVSSLFTLSAILHHHPSLTLGIDSRFHELAKTVLEYLKMDVALDPEVETLARSVVEAWEADLKESGEQEWEPQAPRSRVTSCLRDSLPADHGLGFLKDFLSMPKCNAYKLLVLKGIDVEKLASTLAQIERVPPEPHLGETFSKSHQLASKLTPANARSRQTGTEHLLLALLERDPNEPIPLLLNKLGVFPRDLREIIPQLPREL